MSLENFYIFATALQFFALVLLIGAYIFRYKIFLPSASTKQAIFHLWKLLLIFACLLLTMATFSILFSRSILMMDIDYNLYTTLNIVITKTHFGLHMMLTLGAILVLWISIINSVKRKSERSGINEWIALISLFLIVIMITSISHAGDQGAFTFKAFNNWMHILAAGGWAGTVMATVFCIFPFYLTLLQEPLSFYRMLRRLSLVSALSLLLIVVSGIYSSYWLIGSFSGLWLTATGRILSLKLFFVLTMVCVGAINQFYLIPSINRWALSKQDTAALTIIKFTLCLDSLLIIFVLLLAATLSHSMPVYPMMNMPM